MTEPETVAPNSPWLKPEDAAAYMGMTVAQLLKLHDLPRCRLGPRTVRFDIRDLKAYHLTNPERMRAPSIVKIIMACLERYPTTGHVYFLQCRELIKIGYSADPKRRLAELRSSIPFELVMLGSTAGSTQAEKAIHGALEAIKSELLTEWFYANSALFEAIAEVCRD